MKRVGLAVAVATASAVCLAGQSRIEALVAAVRPALPFPAASGDGAVPANNSATARWFVVWPATGVTRVIVRANPLHPEVQKAGAEAMNRINESVEAAERRAQAAYEKALEEIRRTGKASNIDGVTLDDEGVEGERIDAEMELSIELQPAQPFDLTAGEPPEVTTGANGPAWMVHVPAHVYTVETMAGSRERFRAAETWLLFGEVSRPSVIERPDNATYSVSFTPRKNAFAVLLRGNPQLLLQVVKGADWSAIASR
jgi:hypothetical protein